MSSESAAGASDVSDQTANEVAANDGVSAEPEKPAGGAKKRRASRRRAPAASRVQLEDDTFIDLEASGGPPEGLVDEDAHVASEPTPEPRVRPAKKGTAKRWSTLKKVLLFGVGGFVVIAGSLVGVAVYLSEYVNDFSVMAGMEPDIEKSSSADQPAALSARSPQDAEAMLRAMPLEHDSGPVDTISLGQRGLPEMVSIESSDYEKTVTFDGDKEFLLSTVLTPYYTGGEVERRIDEKTKDLASKTDVDTILAYIERHDVAGLPAKVDGIHSTLDNFGRLLAITADTMKQANADTSSIESELKSLRAEMATLQRAIKVPTKASPRVTPKPDSTPRERRAEPKVNTAPKPVQHNWKFVAAFNGRAFLQRDGTQVLVMKGTDLRECGVVTSVDVAGRAVHTPTCGAISG